MATLAQTAEQTSQLLELLESRAVRALYPVQELRLSSLLHFIYKVSLRYPSGYLHCYRIDA